MLGRIVTAACVAWVAGGAAWSQPVETLTYAIWWDMKEIQPGQTNTGAVYAALTPPVGTETKWNTPPGNGTQSGTVRGFASSIMDLVNLGNGTLGTLSWTVPKAFDVAQLPGTPDGNGGITNSHAGQFAPPANSNPVVTNIVKILDLTWTHNGGGTGPFYVLYETKATSGKVYLEVNAWVGEKAVLVNGYEMFMVVPGPGGLGAVVLGIGCLMASRRRTICGGVH